MQLSLTEVQCLDHRNESTQFFCTNHFILGKSVQFWAQKFEMRFDSLEFIPYETQMKELRMSNLELRKPEGV